MNLLVLLDFRHGRKIRFSHKECKELPVFDLVWEGEAVSHRLSVGDSRRSPAVYRLASDSGFPPPAVSSAGEVWIPLCLVAGPTPVHNRVREGGAATLQDGVRDRGRGGAAPPLAAHRHAGAPHASLLAHRLRGPQQPEAVAALEANAVAAGAAAAQNRTELQRRRRADAGPAPGHRALPGASGVAAQDGVADHLVAVEAHVLHHVVVVEAGAVQEAVADVLGRVAARDVAARSRSVPQSVQPTRVRGVSAERVALVAFVAHLAVDAELGPQNTPVGYWRGFAAVGRYTGGRPVAPGAVSLTNAERFPL